MFSKVLKPTKTRWSESAAAGKLPPTIRPPETRAGAWGGDTMTLKLAEVYGPIAEPIERVRRLFDDELAGTVDRVEELCAHVRGYQGKMLRPALRSRLPQSRRRA